MRNSAADFPGTQTRAQHRSLNQEAETNGYGNEWDYVCKRARKKTTAER